MSMGDRHAVNTSRGDRLRVINHEGKKILQTQVRHSAMPDYVGQCLMFRGMQERWLSWDTQRMKKFWRSTRKMWLSGI